MTISPTAFDVGGPGAAGFRGKGRRAAASTALALSAFSIFCEVVYWMPSPWAMGAAAAALGPEGGGTGAACSARPVSKASWVMPPGT